MMRRLINLLVLLVIALTSPTVSAQSPPPKKILEDMLHALGGQAYLDVDDIHTTGRFYQFKRGELSGGDTFEDYIKFPMMERTEFGREKRKEIQINNADQGWKITPKDKEPKEQVPAEIEEFKAAFRTSLDYILRFTLSDSKTTIQHVGSEILDFNRADLIELRDGLKNRIVFYIDRTTKLPVKMQVRRSDEKIFREERYGNWHAFQGIRTPLYVGRFTDGEKTMEMRLDSAVYNSNLPDSLFTVSKK
jgi:hypothetical protein